MKPGWIVLIVVAVIVIALVGWTVSSYNGLVSLRESVNQQYANIDAQLQRRADLIPNLVESVKGFNIQEQAIVDSVTSARAALNGASTTEERFAAEGELSGALSRLLVVVENYPELKSDATFTQLMDELAGTENRIATARKDYNDTVGVYNARIRTFPTNLIAGMFGHEQATYFEAAPGSDQAPVVDFTS